MLRALLWKEWRQLALVRWGGVALGALLPLACSIGVELAHRGLLPAPRTGGPTSRDLMFELLPASLALGLWPLIALMSAAQAFAGDRAAGTESFLVDRPVPRAAVWRARLLASSGTLVAVIVATGALAAMAAARAGAPQGIGWSRWTILSSVGAGVAFLAYLGGLIAASLLTSPLGAVLAGAVLGALPLVLAAQSGYFMYARIGEVPFGFIVPIALLPAYAAASWLAFCRGEPAGRGRVRRAVTVLVATAGGALIVFLAGAPVAVRANAARGMHALSVAPSGRTAFVSPGGEWGGGGWVVDVATARKLAFVPPPVREIAWKPDGSEFAALTSSGPLGSLRSDERIDVLSTTDGRLLRTLPVAGDIGIVSMTWAKDGLVTVAVKEASKKSQAGEIEIIDPATGAMRGTGFVHDPGFSMQLITPTEDGRIFARVMVDEKRPDGTNAPRGFHLHEVDVAAARVGAAISDASGSALLFAGWSGGLSPSGRFARVVGAHDDLDDAYDVRILDLTAGAGTAAVPSPRAVRWVSGDRFMWHEDLGHRSRLYVASPGAAPKALREWQDAQVGIEPSPDRRSVFVSVIPAGGPPVVDPKRRPPDAALFEGSVPKGPAPEELLYLPDEDRFVTLGRPFSDRPSDMRYSQWAGPRTLARIAAGVVFFEDVDKPGTRRFVIGGSRDLE